jgi:hypothetical protein
MRAAGLEPDYPLPVAIAFADIVTLSKTVGWVRRSV